MCVLFCLSQGSCLAGGNTGSRSFTSPTWSRVGTQTLLRRQKRAVVLWHYSKEGQGHWGIDGVMG